MPPDPLRYFRPEAADLVGQLDAGLADLAASPSPAAEGPLLGKLFRLAHTLKGAARIVRHKELADASHALESWLSPLREGRPPASFAEARALLDHMLAEVAALNAPAATAPPAAVAPAPSPPVRERGPTPLPDTPDSTPVRERGPTPLPDTPVAAVTAPRTTTRERKPSPAPPTSPRPARARAADAPVAVFAVERTDLSGVLDGLAELQGRVAKLKALDDPGQLVARVEQIERELRHVRQEAEQLQLVPARTVFAALERVARDSGADLSATGGEIRLEAAVLAVLHGAIVQLVRNAIAHGIESAGERTAAGKPARGAIKIELVQHGARVTVGVRDDGRGVDWGGVHRALARRGTDSVPSPDDHAGLARALLEGGVSTAAEITQLAGRGVGLDVVRAAAEQLGGEVSVTSTPGAGAVFSMTVPVMMSTLRAIVVEHGGHAVALPLAAVRRVARITPDSIVADGRARSLVDGDVALPFAALHQMLGSPAAATGSALVLEGAALGVAHVLGVVEVVQRARPAGVELAPIVGALYLDDEGLARPVLDPGELARAIAASEHAPEAARARPAPILVIDDSLTTRMLEQAILETAGYEVELASSAEEGLAKAERARYSLFLVDVEMPGMDGFTFVAQTRAHATLGRVPAILVTSRNAPEDRARGLAAGASGYLIKGELDQRELLALIEKLAVIERLG